MQQLEGIKAKALKPQIAQMSADFSPDASHLRTSASSVVESGSGG
jgi:hypothetical protein